MSRRGSGNAYRLKLEQPELVQSVLKSTLRQCGLDKEVEKYNFVLYWDKIVGSELAKRTKPDGIRGKRLYVKVGNSVWIQELSFHKEIILNRLSKYLSTDVQVEDIFFVVGDIS